MYSMNYTKICISLALEMLFESWIYQLYSYETILEQLFKPKYCPHSGGIPNIFSKGSSQTFGYTGIKRETFSLLVYEILWLSRQHYDHKLTFKTFLFLFHELFILCRVWIDYSSLFIITYHFVFLGKVFSSKKKH